MENVIEFFTNNFSTCIWLAVIILAMIPTLESKIAIPFAMNSGLWGSSALPAWQAFLFAFIGSLIPCIVSMLVTRKIKSKTTGFIANTIKKRYSIKSLLIEREKSYFKKYLTLATFVALPLPLTGVWAGSMLAGLSDLSLKNCFFAIAIGAFVSCCIVTLLCTIFVNSLGALLMISLFIIILFVVIELVVDLIKPLIKKDSKQ